MALSITFGLGIFFLIGVLIVHFAGHQHLVEHISIALALGAMVALSAFDLIPDILESFSGLKLLIGLVLAALGVGLLMALDHFIPEHEGSEESEEGNLIHIGIMSAIAIILHNILEGMTVYGIAFGSASQGFSLAMGIGLHNIPMGMLIYSTLKNEHTYKKSLILALSVLSTFIGGCLMFFISPLLNETMVASMVCITFGMVVYIVAFELLPSVIHSKAKVRDMLCAVLGFGIVLASSFLE